MHRTAILLPLVVLGAAFAGCDRQTMSRYQPTSIDEAFDDARKPGVGLDVYELPASSPARIGDEVRPRAKRQPGLLLKPVDMVGLSASLPSSHLLEPTALVAMEEPPPRSPPPGPAHRIASWNPHQEPGAKESISTPLYAPRLVPGRSVYRAEPQKMGAYHDFERVWNNEAADLR
jgi:hypothetical protein